MTDTSATAPESPEAPEQIIDLDAARKARREKRGSAPVVVFFGERFELPLGLPADVIDLVGEVNGGDLTKASEAFKILLGGPEIFDRLTATAKAHGEVLEFEDVVFLLEKTLEIYEVTLPESSASARQS